MYSKNDILRQLHGMRAPKDRVVLVHSSMRTVGEVDGGAEGLLDTLIEYFTAEGGLLCIPTHTAGNWFRKKEITLDMSIPDNDLGVLSKIAAQRRDCVRSENPVLSMAVFGDKNKAERFIYDDAFITTPTAPESCYGKLASQNGYVLLVGVGHEKNTFLHCVAESLPIDDRMSDVETPVTVKRVSGELVHRTIRMYSCSKTNNVSLRFPKYETAFRYHGCITDGFLGNAPTQLCDAKKMQETVKYILQNSDGADPLATEHPIPPAWFCKKRNAFDL